MSMKVKCKCGAVHTLADSAVGKIGLCKECGNKFKIMKPSPAPKADTQKSVKETAQEQIKQETDNKVIDDLDTLSIDSSDASDDLILCPFCGEEIKRIAKKCKHCMEYLDPVLIKANSSSNQSTGSNINDPERILKQIYDREHLSSIFWIVFGVLQCCTGYLAIAGIWNIINGFLSRKLLEKIKRKDSDIPEVYDKSSSGIVIIGVVNIFLGGLIGVAFAVYDYYLRKLVLENKALFNNLIEHKSEVKEILEPS